MSQTGVNGKDHDRYVGYRRLRIDWPHERVIRVTMANGKMNSADATMHAELGRIRRFPPLSSRVQAKCSPLAATLS